MANGPAFEKYLGPYEEKIALHTGNTNINGPHQGGIVDLKSGEWWFVHFQDRGAYGRIVHLQPVIWKDGWPYMGSDMNDDGIGEPVPKWQKPNVGRSFPIILSQTSDEYDMENIGLQWQWHANPQTGWYSLTENSGSLRLYAVKNLTQNGNLWFVPNLLLQKFPASSFTVSTAITFKPDEINEKSGLLIMGKEWAFVALTKTSNGLQLGMYTGTFFQGYDKTQLIESIDIQRNICFLRVHVDEQSGCHFFNSFDDRDYQPIGKEFRTTAGTWIGAKVGLFNINPNMSDSEGYADYDWFRFQ